MDPRPGVVQQLGPVGLAAAVIALLSQSFCCNVGWSEDAVVESQGRVVESTSHGMNYGALTLGPLAIVVAIAAIVVAFRGPADLRTGRLVVAAVAIALAAFGTWGSVW
jgi:hypothetical protein